MTSASAKRCSSMSTLYSSTSVASRCSTSILRPRSLSILSSIIAFWRSSSSSFRRLPVSCSISERVRCTRRPKSLRVASGSAVSAATVSAVLSSSSIASRGFFSASRFASSCCAATCAESFAAMTSGGRDSVGVVCSAGSGASVSAAHSDPVMSKNAMVSTTAAFRFGVIRARTLLRSEPLAKAMP